MNARLTRIHRAAALPFLAAAAATALGSGPALAADACTPTSHSMVQRRVVEKAGEGPEALIRFVSLSKPVYQLDLEETVAWLDTERDRRNACLTALNAAKPAPR